MSYELHPAYRSLNKILTIMGCERRLFLAGTAVGYGLFVMVNSMMVGIVVFLIFATMGYFKAQDPVRLRLLFNPGRYRASYDAGERNAFHASIHDRHSY